MYGEPLSKFDRVLAVLDRYRLARFCAQLATLALVAAAVLMTASCTPSASTAADTRSEAGLDIIPVTVRQDGKAHVFQAEVARTPEEQARGLMYRTEIGADEAMLFPFPKPKYASFWQKNMIISIDMLYIRPDGTVDRIVENTVPGDVEPAVSGGLVGAVLEVAGGTAARLGLDESATVDWPRD